MNLLRLERKAAIYAQTGEILEALKTYQQIVRHFESLGENEISLRFLQKMADLVPEQIDQQIKLAELFRREGHELEAKHQLRSTAQYLWVSRAFDQLNSFLENLRQRGFNIAEAVFPNQDP